MVEGDAFGNTRATKDEWDADIVLVGMALVGGQTVLAQLEAVAIVIRRNRSEQAPESESERLLSGDTDEGERREREVVTHSLVYRKYVFTICLAAVSMLTISPI